MTCGAAGLTAILVPFVTSSVLIASVVSLAWTVTPG